MKESTRIGIGTTVAGRYRLVTELARGAAGAVYEAVDREEGGKAAVKVLHAEYLANDAMRRRLRREGAVLKALSHPAIVRLLELVVEDDGRVCLVTELVEGEPLTDRLKRGPLSIEEADALLLALAGGLRAAHEHGVLHGDLKPANVLWSSDADGSRARLVDFSASKILGLDRLTATGEISGTPEYMAPEVLTGKSEIDSRIDVYGIGVLLYEALSTRRPFEDAHIGRLLMKVDAGDYLPLDAVAEVPPSIANVVGRAMHASKEQRYASAAELLSAWQEARGA